MPDVDTLKSQIQAAFAAGAYPGDACLRGSDEGVEPFRVERDFRGKTDWRTLDPAFIDQSPDGLGSALSFFSDAAFRFYLPAYLLADLDGLLVRAEPLYHLTHGLRDAARGEPINPRRYGAETWLERTRRRFAPFTPAEAAAIVAYLRYQADVEPLDRERIDQALRNYWLGRADGG